MRTQLVVIGVCAGLAACGGGGDDPDAARPPDALSWVDAADGDVAVRVYDDAGAPVTGTDVVLHASDGEVLDAQQTDAAGACVFVNPPYGAMVSILRRQATVPHYEVYTAVGVQRGDTIVLGTPPAPADSTVDVRVSYPGAFAGADSYLADMGCRRFGVQDPAAVVTQTISSACLGGDDDFSALALARQGTTPIAFATARDVPRAASGPTPIAIPAWTPSEERTVAITNLPPDTTDTSIDLRPVLDGLVLGPNPSTATGIITPAAALVDGWYTRTGVTATAGTELRLFVRRHVLPAATPNAMTLDFAEYGPRVETVDVDLGLPARPRTSWTTSAPTAGNTALALRLHWDDPATAPETNHSWVVILPADRTYVSLPTLPDALAAYRPSATTSYLHTMVFVFWFERFEANYREFRNDRPFRLGNALVDPSVDGARMSFLQVEGD